MVTDLFGSLLEELIPFVKIPALRPDTHGSCLLKLENEAVVQLDIDKSGLFLNFGADLGTLPPGKYRENIFREALKSNSGPPPVFGIFAYSKPLDRLVLFGQLPLRDLNGEKIASYLFPFAEKSLYWTNAIKNGEVPAGSSSYTSSRGTGGGMFGLS